MSSPKLIHWLICDDIRKEINGKTTYVGVYGQDITVPFVPLPVPQINISLLWDLKNGSFEEIIIKIEKPDGKYIGPFKAKGPKNIANIAKTWQSLNISMFPFVIPAIGIYKLFIKVDDEMEKNIGQFEVKLSQKK